MKFVPRGIGSGWAVCFCCNEPQPDCSGKSRELLTEMAAFTENYESARKIKAMFLLRGSNCLVDYRDYEPNRVQVKVGACGHHVKNLEELLRRTSEKETISEHDIEYSIMEFAHAKQD